ncbi:MAG: glycosyltransferase [Defluviicoccus sp.]|nr:MAG: glycosyltransferase [Defluviicoccus sp.]
MLSLVRGLARCGTYRGTYRVDVVLGARKGPLVADVPPDVRVVELGTASSALAWTSLLRLPWTTARRLPAALLGRKLPSALRCLPRLVRYLQDERPDAVFTTLPYNNIALLWAAALAGTPTRTVVREANMPSIDIPRGARAFDRLLPDLMRAWYPAAHGIAAVSEGVARSCPVHRNGCAADHGDSQSARSAAHPGAGGRTARRRLVFSGAPPVIVAAGRLAPQKDYPMLLRAVARLAAGRQVRLLILGEGSERPALEHLAESLGINEQVRMPGAVDNPFKFVGRAAVFALSSAWEGGRTCWRKRWPAAARWSAPRARAGRTSCSPAGRGDVWCR